MKRRRPASLRPASHILLTIPEILDEDFDNSDELVVEEPPICAALGFGARRVRPSRDPEDEF